MAAKRPMPEGELEERLASLSALSRDSTWCFEAPTPVDTGAPIEAQLAALASCRLVYCNDAYVAFHGASSADALLGRTFGELNRGASEATIYAYREALRSSYRLDDVDVLMVRHDGARRLMRTTVFAMLDADGGLTRIWGRNADVTELHVAAAERERLDEQLERAARLESLGSMALGVAHDFNNLLTVILGAAELATADDADESESMATVRDAALRARDLTHQLLAFAKNEPTEPRALDLREVLAGLEPILRRVFPDRIELDLCEPDAPMMLMGDPSQLEQLLMNLAINARDAMPSGGRLEIALDATALGASDAAVATGGMRPGDAVRIRVSDEGMGMSPEVRERIFDPLFTTKPEGVGTGLGLSIVQRTLRAHGGWIAVDSEPGIGSTFTVYLPALRVARNAGESRRVLVAEDEPLILSLFERILEREGYEVISASSGRRALELLEEDPGRFDAVVSDVVMSGVSGIEVFEAARARLPNVPVLLCSGYTAGLVPASVLEQPRCRLLHKPFRADTLLAALDELILAS